MWPFARFELGLGLTASVVTWLLVDLAHVHQIILPVTLVIVPPGSFDRFACGPSQVFPVAATGNRTLGVTKCHHGAMTDPPPAPVDRASDKETSRLEAFSDGVLAVIITITAFGLRAPVGGSFGALGQRLPALASRHDEPCHRNSQYLAAWTCARGGLLAIEEQ